MCENVIIMRQAKESDRTLMARHVLKHYLDLVESDADEYLHQIGGLKEIFPHLFDEKVFEEGYHLIVCDESQKIIGTAGLTPEKDHWKLVSVYIDEMYRGRGIGNSLVKELIEIARIKCVEKIKLCTLPNQMKIAPHLYEKFGFKLVNEIKAEKYKYSNKMERPMIYHIYELVL